MKPLSETSREKLIEDRDSILSEIKLRLKQPWMNGQQDRILLQRILANQYDAEITRRGETKP